MQLITVTQIKQARALLNWTQYDLAEKLDMWPQQLSVFLQAAPTRVNKQRTARLEEIRAVFEKEGVRFTSTGGVEMAPAGAAQGRSASAGIGLVC